MSSNSPKRLPYWNSTSGFHFDHITAVDMSLITSCRFSRWRISAILEFRDPISPCTTSYRSSIETIALNCLVFEKIAFLQFGDRQTNKQTNRRTCPLHEAAVAVASGGLISKPRTRRVELFVDIFTPRCSISIWGP